MTPWGYIWSGFGLLAFCGFWIGIGMGTDMPAVVAAASIASAFPTALIGIGIVGQGVKISRNR